VLVAWHLRGGDLTLYTEPAYYERVGAQVIRALHPLRCCFVFFSGGRKMRSSANAGSTASTPTATSTTTTASTPTATMTAFTAANDTTAEVRDLGSSQRFRFLDEVCADRFPTWIRRMHTTT
jgi:hypothetical protein